MPQEPETDVTRPVGTPVGTMSARLGAPRKKHFWLWMITIGVGSGVMAIFIARWGYRGQSRVLVAAIWYVFMLIGYRLLKGSPEPSHPLPSASPQSHSHAEERPRATP
jgi:hypothetical protein